MKIHYFQRYHGKENVSTANTMLLLSRLYDYAPDKFFNFLKKEIFQNEDDDIELGVQIELQERAVHSIPDASIEQPSFRVVVETKMSEKGKFDLNQLKRHLETFEKGTRKEYQVLLTLAPAPMKPTQQDEFKKILDEHNELHNNRICHKNITFEAITEAVRDLFDEIKDYEMCEIINDFDDYCFSSGLYTNAQNRMCVQLAGKTFNLNKELGLYYNKRYTLGYRYLGLYKDKAVRAIGKIVAVVKVDINTRKNDIIEGEPLKDMQEKIDKALTDYKNRDWADEEIYFFFVDKFYETEFIKKSNYAPRGHRMFNLDKELGVKKLPDTTEEIAEQLKKKWWK